MPDFNEAFQINPLIAILRGITPTEVLDATAVLVETGFSMVEVPLNSPNALDSIRRLALAYGDRILVGAGTVLTDEQVRAVHGAGGKLIVAPNFSPAVIAESKALGLGVGPGIATMTEAFAALESGADFLKLFPAEMIPPAAVMAMRAVLPKTTLICPVGGIRPETMETYFNAGANGFGLGSALYRPGQSAEVTQRRASAFITALHRK